MVASNSAAARARGADLAQHIAFTRPHLLPTPRFRDLPWPPGFDLDGLAAKQMRDIDSPRNARVVAQLVPVVIAGAAATWEGGDIAAVREGRMSADAWRSDYAARQRELKRSRRRYPSPFG